MLYREPPFLSLDYKNYMIWQQLHAQSVITQSHTQWDLTEGIHAPPDRQDRCLVHFCKAADIKDKSHSENIAVRLM